MKNTLILLTLNEIDGVRAMVPQLPNGLADETLAVDGGSTDGTREFFEAKGIPVAVQGQPGRGEAIRAGVRMSSGDHLVFFSPDGNEDPKDIPLLFQKLEEGADMVIASRLLPGACNEDDNTLIPLRKWVNQAFNLTANLLWNRGPRVTDTINGFRGITRSAFMELAPQSMGFTIEYEMTIRAMKSRMKILEIPTIEGHRIGGKVKATSLPTGLRFVRLFLKELLRKDAGARE